MKRYALGDLLSYEQPTEYIVESTDYDESYEIPVLTAGKTFILGYTNEKNGVYDNLPVIIFDDFTTSSRYVNFKFKVKSSAMKILTPNTELVIPKYVYYLMQTIKIDNGTHKRYWIQQYSKIKVSIPPISEQEQIVSKIEELFSELDKAVETLQTTKKQLAVYRQAVLKQEYDGNWNYYKAEDLCYFITKGTTPKRNELLANGDIPFIKVYNLTFDTSLDFSIDPTFISIKTHNNFLSRSIVYPNDVLMNIVGPPMGKVSIVPNTYKEWNINQAIVRFRCNDKINNKFLAYYLSSSPVVEKMKSQSKATAGQFNLTLEICRSIEIPLPPLKVQEKIVKEIELQLSACDSIQKAVDAALSQTEAMRQSILKKTFEGGL